MQEVLEDFIDPAFPAWWRLLTLSPPLLAGFMSHCAGTAAPPASDAAHLAVSAELAASPTPLVQPRFLFWAPCLPQVALELACLLELHSRRPYEARRALQPLTRTRHQLLVQ